MRKARLVKRRRVSFLWLSFAVLWIGADMGMDFKSGVIAKDFSAFLQDRLEGVFADKAVKLSRLEGGLFSSLSVADVRIGSLFSVDKIILKYNLFNLLLRRYEKFGGICLISPSWYLAAAETPARDISSISAPLARRSAYMSGPIECRVLNGTIFGLNKKPIVSNLAGVVRFSGAALNFRNVKGSFFGLPVLVNGRIQDPFGSPVLKLRLAVKEKYYTARLAFRSAPKSGSGAIWGRLNIFDKYNFNFKGRIGFGAQNVIKIEDFSVGDYGWRVNGEIDAKQGLAKFLVEPKTGFIRVSGSLNSANGLSVLSKVSHLDLFSSDLLCDIIINAKLHQLTSASPMLTGSLKTQNLIVNYKPFKELSARWAWKKDKVLISSLVLGDSYRLSGFIGLRRPYNVDLRLDINAADIADWLVFSKYGEDELVSGSLNGEARVRGPLREPQTKVKLNLKDGNFKDLKFNSVNLNLDGKGPVLTIGDSRIFKEDGCLYVNGEMDLAKLGKRNVFEDVNVTTDQRVVVWDGWDVSKDMETAEVRLKKDISEDFRVNFKAYSNRDRQYSEQSQGEVGVDYKIRKDDSINVRMKEDDAFVGVEHKVKF